MIEETSQLQSESNIMTNSTSANDNVSFPPYPQGEDSLDHLIPFPSILIDEATGEVVTVDELPEHAVIVTTEDGTGLVLHRTSAEKVAPVDANLKASLMRQGRTGLTAKEGRRRSKFRPSESVQFPVMYEGQSWENFNRHLMRYMDALAFRTMHTADLTPGAVDAKKGRQAVAQAVLDQAMADDPGYVRDDTMERVRTWQGRARKNQEHLFTGDIGFQVIVHAADSAAAWAWDRYDASVYERLSAWGRSGGAESKRPKEVTADMILAFPFADPSAPVAKKIIAGAIKNPKTGKPITVRTVEKRLQEHRDAHLAYRSQPEAPEAGVLPEWDTSSLMFMNAELARIEDDGLTDDLESWMEHELAA